MPFYLDGRHGLIRLGEWGIEEKRITELSHFKHTVNNISNIFFYISPPTNNTFHVIVGQLSKITLLQPSDLYVFIFFSSHCSSKLIGTRIHRKISTKRWTKFCAKIVNPTVVCFDLIPNDKLPENRENQRRIVPKSDKFSRLINHCASYDHFNSNFNSTQSH